MKRLRLNRHFFRDWWLSVSIRRKMLFFIALVIFMVLFITFSCIGMLNIYLRDFNIVLGDSYSVNAALISFEKEQEAYRVYANDRSDDLYAGYEAARKAAKEDVSRLRFSYRDTGISRYLLTQAIRISHEAYMSRCDKSLRLPQESDTFIKQYYTTLKTGSYIDSYIKQLMQATLAEGNEDYYNKVRVFRILPFLAIVMAAVIILFAIVLCSITVHHIINPVLKLADASREIAANKLSGPDVQVSNRDEIGELVTVFNIMKHATAHSIAALQEKSEMENRFHQEELARINTEKMLKTMQMSLLQSQINPHFLFNTLNTISRTAKIESARNTEELILRLANLFRYNLQTASERVPLTRELNIIRDYIYIQHMRFGAHIVFELDCRVNSDEIMVPTFTLQPLVENAVIHGVAPKEGGGQIRIRIKERRGEVTLTVTDSGGGMLPGRLRALLDDTAQHKGHLSGIGLGNVKTRMELLYPNSRFRIFSRVGLGTAVRITLPVSREEQ